MTASMSFQATASDAAAPRVGEVVENGEVAGESGRPERVPGVQPESLHRQRSGAVVSRHQNLPRPGHAVTSMGAGLLTVSW
jgi:hypothetical protein